MDWTDLDKDKDRWYALINVVINLRIPSNSGKYLTGSGRVSFLGSTLLH